MANSGTSGHDARLEIALGVNGGVPNVRASFSRSPGGRTSRRPSTLGTAPELALGDFKAANKQQQPVAAIENSTPPPPRRRSESGNAQSGSSQTGSASSGGNSAAPVASGSTPSRGSRCRPPKGGRFSFRPPCFGGSAASKSKSPLVLDQRAQIAQFPAASRKLSAGTLESLAKISGASKAEKKSDSTRKQSVSAPSPPVSVDHFDAPPSPPEVPAPPPSEAEFASSIPSGPPSEPGADVPEIFLPPLGAEEGELLPQFPDQPPFLEQSPFPEEPPFLEESPFPEHPPFPEQPLFPELSSLPEQSLFLEQPLPKSSTSQCRCATTNPPIENDVNSDGVSLGNSNSLNKTFDPDQGNSSGQNALNAALLNAQAPDIIELVRRAESPFRQGQVGTSPIRGLRPDPGQNAGGRYPLRQGRYVIDSSTMARTAGAGQPGPGRPPGGARFNRQQMVRSPSPNVRGYDYNNLQTRPIYENPVPSPPTTDSGVARLFDAIIGRGDHLEHYDRQEQEDQQQLGVGNRPQGLPEPANFVPSPPKTNAGVTRIVDAILGREEHLEQYDWQQQQQEDNLRTRAALSPDNFIQRQQWLPQVRQLQPNAIPGRSQTAAAGGPSSSRTPRFRGARTRGFFSEPSDRDSGPGSGSGPGPSTGPGSGPGSGSIPNDTEAGMDSEYGADQDMEMTGGQNFQGQTSDRGAMGAGDGAGIQDTDMSPERSGDSEDICTSEEIESQDPEEFVWKRKVVDKPVKGRRGGKVDFDYHRRRGHPDTTFNPRPGDIIIRARKRSGLRLTDFFYYDNENYLEQGDQILRAKFEYLPPMDTMYLWCRLYVYGADGTYTYLDSTSEIVEKFKIDADVTTFKNTARFT